jgi:uncharacterized membrane protein
MKYAREFLKNALVGGLLVVLPIYFTVLLLLKGMQALKGLVQPIAGLLPEWLPATALLSLLLLLGICFLVGLLVRTRPGRNTRRRIEESFLGKLPGYSVFRSVTQRLAGDSEGSGWQPALAEIEDALVPSFIVEEHDDGRLTVFVPSVPTPFAGAVYVLDRERVHAVDVPFAQAIKSVSRWGAGSKELVAAMRTGTSVPSAGNR